MKLFLLTDSEDEYGYTLYIGIFKTIDGITEYYKNYPFTKSIYGEINSVEIVIEEGKDYGWIKINGKVACAVEIIDTEELK